MKKISGFILAILLLLSSALAENPLPENALTAEVLSRYSVVSEEPVTLKIGLAGNARMSGLLDAAFLTKYPNATIEYVEYTEEQRQALLQDGTDLPDLLMCTHITMEKLAAQGLLSDFYQSGLFAAWPEESAWPEAWIDLSGELEMDGRLYGLPRYILQDYWLQNNELAAESGVQLPGELYDWDEFLEAAAGWKYDTDGNGVRDIQLILGRISENEYRKNMVEDFFEAYLDGRMLDHRELAEGATFGTEEFRHLLEIYAKLLAVRGDAAGMSEVAGDYQSSYLFRYFGQLGDFHYNNEKNSVVPLPVVHKDEPEYLGILDVACIPQQAEHPELALAYCEGMLDADLNCCYEDLGSFFFKTLPVWYVEADYPEITAGEPVKVTAAALHPELWRCERTALTPQEFDMYTFCHEHALLRSFLWRELNAEWEPCLNGYLEGSLSFEQVAERLDAALAQRMQAE